MSLHTLTLVFGPNANILKFTFKDREAAMKAYEASKRDASMGIFIKDDYGTEGEVVASAIHARVLEDISGVWDGRSEAAIADAKGQIKAQNKAGNDPMLKLHMSTTLNHPGAPNGGRRPPFV